MKKSLIKSAVLVIVFIVTILVAEKIMYKEQENITMEMESATLPMVTMVYGDYSYNELHGYTIAQNIGYYNETLTVLDEERSTGFHIDTYGNSISGVSVELRTIDGTRLIESDELSSLKAVGNSIDGEIKLKDLISKDTIYGLTIILKEVSDAGETSELYFYTNVIWSENNSALEKFAYVQDFHDKLFDKESAQELRKYLETDSKKNDNSSFADVTIYSSFDQITYGDLEPEQLDEPMMYLKDITDSTASITLQYVIWTDAAGTGQKTYYLAQEYYRIRLGTERMYLLDYERTMEQVTEPDSMCINDKIVLGIRDTDVDYKESEDGNTVAFVTAGKLYSYQMASNKLVELFAFKGDDEFDRRIIFGEHDIKILDIDEAGGITFAIFGYMNSGRHEGEVGIEVYRFDSTYNTNEELVYIPYEKSAQMLESELDTLLYMNREQNLYLTLENKVYCINLDDRSYEIRDDVEKSDTLITSSDRRILISSEQYEDTDDYSSKYIRKLILTNLKTEKEIVISAPYGDAIRSMGFMGEDVVYGIAHISDIKIENSGHEFFPMYCIVICDEEGKTLKKYEYDGYYTLSIEQNDNQLTLERVTIDENGNEHDAAPDYITTSEYEEGQTITDATTIIDTYETYVQLQLPDEVDSDRLMIVYPKEIVYEGGRILSLSMENVERFYAYGPFGLADIYNYTANAVNKADEETGWVYSTEGILVWKKQNLSKKNQIMSITEEDIPAESTNSLAICLDEMMATAGVVRDSEYLLENGGSAMSILTDNLTDYLIVDLTGCNLDSLLYYVANDIPVLAMVEDDNAVLITGYNEEEIVLFDPSEGVLRKMSRDDAESYFEQNGDIFITYVAR